MQRSQEILQKEKCEAVISSWVTSVFSRPRIDPEWLRECFEWVFAEQEYPQKLNGNNSTDSNFSNIWHKVIDQFLESNLTDSTIRGSGLGSQIIQQDTGILQGPPLLVQVIAVSEIIRPNRRPTVKLKLSDGENSIYAIVHPSLLASRHMDFDSLRLGYKMLLDSPRLRRGVLYLNSITVTLMGGGCNDLDENQIIHREKK